VKTDAVVIVMGVMSPIPVMSISPVFIPVRVRVLIRVAVSGFVRAIDVVLVIRSRPLRNIHPSYQIPYSCVKKYG
jgi:hypothetical protein